MADQTILEVKDLKKYFNTAKGMLHAVDGVSFKVKQGETLGLVGESGCGKSTTGRCIMRLLDLTSGQIIFNNQDITNYTPRQMRPLRTDIQMIFQDPFSSLDPRQTIMQLISEPIRELGLFKDKKEIEKKTLELMDIVGLASRLVNSYPHELDGGRRQRIGVARALSVNPKLIICDEPVSSLDVSIQAQILNLLKKLQNDLGLTYIFITHDLSVVKYFSNDISVMYLGQMVEKASSDELFAYPMHPYTKALLSSIPNPVVGEKKQERVLIKGEIISPVNLPDSCRFYNRCDFGEERCLKGNPQLREVRPNHFVACTCVE